ncbi:MAG: response regulator [Rhodothermales bacterium]
MRRILFVDDESRILDGIRRMLRPYRNEWDMQFASSGEEALSMLASAPFDVIVSDMRMPGMDGSELLSRVQKDYPDIVRIVLSGHAELSAMLRALSVAHHFLSKPCEAGALRSVFTRACDLKDLLVDDTLRRLIGGLSSLPAIPRVYSALLGALNDPTISIPGIARIVEQDASISSTLLHIANSGFFGTRKEVTSIEHAINQLGLRLVKNLVLSIELFNPEARKTHPPEQWLESMQRHALLVAGVATRILPRRSTFDELFVAGLLHDIGKRVLASEDPDRYQRLVALMKESRLPMHVVERREYGVSHAEIGAYMLNLWGLPHSIVEAVAHHHEPWRMSEDQFDLPQAIYVANILVHEQSSDPLLGSEHYADFDYAYLDRLGVTPQLDDWRRIAQQRIEQNLSIL